MSKLRQPEVHQYRLSLSGHHDVGRLDVAVDDALAVCLLETSGDLFSEIQQALDVDRP